MPDRAFNPSSDPFGATFSRKGRRIPLSTGESAREALSRRPGAG